MIIEVDDFQRLEEPGQLQNPGYLSTPADQDETLLLSTSLGVGGDEESHPCAVEELELAQVDYHHM